MLSQLIGETARRAVCRRCAAASRARSPPPSSDAGRRGRIGRTREEHLAPVRIPGRTPAPLHRHRFRRSRTRVRPHVHLGPPRDVRRVRQPAPVRRKLWRARLGPSRHQGLHSGPARSRRSPSRCPLVASRRHHLPPIRRKGRGIELASTRTPCVGAVPSAGCTASERPAVFEPAECTRRPSGDHAAVAASLPSVSGLSRPTRSGRRPRDRRR